MFGKKKKQENEICVRLGEHEVYRGTLTDLPLKEEIILEKSEEFFNDPNPCFIHRSAVRVRLLAELEEAAGRGEWELWEKIDCQDMRGVTQLSGIAAYRQSFFIQEGSAKSENSRKKAFPARDSGVSVRDMTQISRSGTVSVSRI